MEGGVIDSFDTGFRVTRDALQIALSIPGIFQNTEDERERRKRMRAGDKAKSCCWLPHIRHTLAQEPWFTLGQYQIREQYLGCDL